MSDWIPFVIATLGCVVTFWPPSTGAKKTLLLAAFVVLGGWGLPTVYPARSSLSRLTICAMSHPAMCEIRQSRSAKRRRRTGRGCGTPRGRRIHPDPPSLRVGPPVTHLKRSHTGCPSDLTITTLPSFCTIKCEPAVDVPVANTGTPRES